MSALMAHGAPQGTPGLPSPTDYDLADDPGIDGDGGSGAPAKRPRMGDSALHGLSRVGSRIPSLSQRWRRRKAGNSIVVDDGVTELGPSRANSTRASSVAGSITEPSAGPEPPQPQLPLTPTGSIHTGDPEASSVAPIDIQRANAPPDGADKEGTATTPLLPPIIAQFPSYIQDVPFQSPLQSPSVAPSPTVADHDCPFAAHSPVHTAPASGLPSPPLSAKPSVSSFHRQRGLSQPQPLSDATPILMADNHDEWSLKLGHANFTIYPEPYLPTQSDLPACRKLRADWDLARCQYTKHVMRTGEHFGVTSKIYRLTEEKWAEIDAVWQRNSERTVSRAVGHGFEAERSLRHGSVAPPTPLKKLPSLNGPRSEGKFPTLGDEGIVGPMEQIASPRPPRRPSRTAGFFRFLHGVMPTSVGLFGRSVRSRSLSP